MQSFAEIPVLLGQHPEIDIVRALAAINLMLAGEPVDFTRTVQVAHHTSLIVANRLGIELGWIGPVPLHRLSVSLDRYMVAAVNFQQPLNFGCMIKVSLIDRPKRIKKRAKSDLVLREFCASRDSTPPEIPIASAARPTI